MVGANVVGVGYNVEVGLSDAVGYNVKVGLNVEEGAGVVGVGVVGAEVGAGVGGGAGEEVGA